MGEPERTKSYSEDLRWRIVWQRKVQNRSMRDIAKNLYVSLATVSRIIDRFDRIGDISPSLPTPRQHALNDYEEFLLVQMVQEKPSVYLHEVQARICAATGTEVSVSTICKTLKRFGFSRRRIGFVAAQRSDNLRARYMAEIPLYDPSMFIFVDEMGSDKRNSLRRYGYALRGLTPRTYSFLSRGRRISAIAAITTTEFLDCYICEGVDADTFYHFVQACLLPQLMPFNGENPNSIVVLDNCSIHHVEEVVELIQSVGALVHFLPPYSPDLNPIEEAFSKVKSIVRAHDELCDTCLDTEPVVRAALILPLLLQRTV